MTDTKTTTISLSWLFWMVVWGCIGYLVYGDLQGAIVLTLFSAITGIALWFGLIPIIGVWITSVILNYVQGWLLNYVAMSWAVLTIFWLGMIGSIICTILVIIAFLAVILK